MPTDLNSIITTERSQSQQPIFKQNYFLVILRVNISHRNTTYKISDHCERTHVIILRRMLPLFSPDKPDRQLSGVICHVDMESFYFLTGLHIEYLKILGNWVFRIYLFNFLNYIKIYNTKRQSWLCCVRLKLPGIWINPI